MATWITLKEGAARFRTLGQLMERQMVNALRWATHAWRLKAFENFSQRGLGRVFGATAVLGTTRQRAGTEQARVIIQRERVTKRGDGLYETGLRLRGFAALVEGGGKTAPHSIGARDDGVLGVPPKGLGMNTQGKPIFARRVQHPGSRIPKQPIVEAAMNQSRLEFAWQMASAAQRSAELAKLAA